jgi:hypothetical protein
LTLPARPSRKPKTPQPEAPEAETPEAEKSELPLVFGGDTAPARTRGTDRRVSFPDLLSGKLASVRLAAATCLGLSVLQVYVVSFDVINISLFWLACLVAAPVAFSGPARHFTLMQVAIGLLALQLISLTWSPTPLTGFNDSLNLAMFMVMLGLGLKLGGKDWEGLMALLRLYCLIAVAQSVLVIGLRVDALTDFALTEAFLRGNLAQLVFEPNILSLFLGGDGWGVDVNPHQINSMGGIYNVFSPGKAGGLELNGNIAGAWGGMLTFLSLGLFDRQKPVRSGLIVLIHAASVIASGSKASLLLLGVVPILVAALRLSPETIGSLKDRVRPWQVIAGGGLLIGLIVAVIGHDKVWQLISQHNDYGRDTLNSTRSRQMLLTHAWQALVPDWLGGHGYGGWVKTYDRPGSFDFPYKLPPHNAFILLWTQSGIAAVACGVAFVGLGLKAMYDLFATRRAGFALGAFAAYMFVVAQAMGENINLFTNLHLTAPLALIIGGSAAQLKALKDEAHARAMGDRRERERRVAERRATERNTETATQKQV